MIMRIFTLKTRVRVEMMQNSTIRTVQAVLG